MKIRKKSDFKVSPWSGGTTTEFYIFPQESNYNKHDFLFRLSSAVVNCEESEFTHLENIRRILYLLEGKLLLIHNGIKTAWLNPREQTTFYGGFNTISKGMAVDFNVMMRENVEASLSCHLLEPEEELAVEVNGLDKKSFLFLYQVRGSLFVKDANGTGLIGEGDLGYCESNDGNFKEIYCNHGQKTAEFLIVQIYVM